MTEGMGISYLRLLKISKSYVAVLTKKKQSAVIKMLAIRGELGT